VCALEVLGGYGDGGDSVFRLPATSPGDFLEEVERPSLTIAVSRQISNVTDVQRARLLMHTWKGDERNGVWSRGEWSTVVVNMKERIQDRALSEESEWARFRGAETSLVNFRAAVSL
jgi:hypothetical protein